MQKNIDCAKLIFLSIDENHKQYLEDNNLKDTFSGIYKMGFSQTEENRLICFTIFAYDPDSPKLNIQKDRYENKYQILKGLGGAVDSTTMQHILTGENEQYNMVVLNYLETLTNWKWIQIFSYLEYHSKMIRFANEKTDSEKSFKVDKEGMKTVTSEYDIEVLTKVAKEKGNLLIQAQEARNKAELLLEEIRKEFVVTDNATQQDFGFSFTETAKKRVDILSWRAFIIERNENKKAG